MAERSTERERIALLAAQFARVGAGDRIRVGIGDDAAVVSVESGLLVWTIDAQVDRTHFRLDWLGWEDVGWRSFMAAASDLAAMGAAPVAALSALALAAQVDDAALAALAKGQADAAARVGAPIVGGNLVRATESSITTTLIGRAVRPIERRGARAGDGIYVAGPLGMAAAGLAALERGGDPRDTTVAECVEAWRRPRAQIERGLTMAPAASASIDVSDGLASDARHIAVASGVAIVLDEVALRSQAPAALEKTAALLGRPLIDFVLEGGEDYALVATSASPLDGFTRIGTVEPGDPAVLLARVDGTRSVVDARGFDHFA